MEKIEKAVKVLALLNEDHACGGLSEQESQFVLTHDIAIPLAWLVEYGYALATEAGNEEILGIYDNYMETFGGSNE